MAESRDPEALELLLASYFSGMKAIIESYGGTVQEFIGDAVVAVFGVPVAHEDDALRALLAAVQMREALPQLGIEGRIGVNTGEIVTSTHGTIVMGDAVNVAARFQQAAAPGEILVGPQTLALARGAATVEELEPLELKGKSAPMAAFKLVAVGRAAVSPLGDRFDPCSIPRLGCAHVRHAETPTERSCRLRRSRRRYGHGSPPSPRASGRSPRLATDALASKSAAVALDAVKCGDPAATLGLSQGRVVRYVLIGVGEGEPKDGALELVAPAEVARDGR